jgi:hypothetical protein
VPWSCTVARHSQRLGQSSIAKGRPEICNARVGSGKAARSVQFAEVAVDDDRIENRLSQIGALPSDRG